MRTHVRGASLAAYQELTETGKLSNQANKILTAMKAGRDYSLQELSRLTGIAINAVSGRCNDMKRLGVLVEATSRKCSITGRSVHPVRIPSINGELSL
ncbi:hypothetical protein [Flavobacterium sp.]|jgi:hypothetical protein|uniref:hypothetical protein n=1 Tax=Flavobacterium sp. TaxID=239 RepID=UPI0037C17C54